MCASATIAFTSPLKCSLTPFALKDEPCISACGSPLASVQIELCNREGKNKRGKALIASDESNKKLSYN